MALSVRDRLHLVRVNLGLSTQAAIAAGLSWYVSHNLLGHGQPFFAPIAAVVVLAISVGQRLRRAIEVVAGNAVGILLGEAIILIIGRGTWQLSLVVFLAILLAILVGGSAPLVTQAAASASLVATLVPWENYFLSRFVDAVVGGSIGLGVMALLLPLNPLSVVRRSAEPILSRLEAGLTATAQALKKRDAELAMRTLDSLRDAEAQLSEHSEGISAAQEIVAVAPLRWRSRSMLGEYVESYPHVARALRNARVLTQRSHTMIIDGEQVPPQLVEAVDTLAKAVSRLRHELASETDPTASRDDALRAAKLSAEAYHGGIEYSGSVVVAQTRSVATDLISAGGKKHEEARRMIRRAAKVGRKAPGK